MSEDKAMLNNAETRGLNDLHNEELTLATLTAVAEPQTSASIVPDNTTAPKGDDQT